MRRPYARRASSWAVAPGDAFGTVYSELEERGPSCEDRVCQTKTALCPGLLLGAQVVANSDSWLDIDRLFEASVSLWDPWFMGSWMPA